MFNVTGFSLLYIVIILIIVFLCLFRLWWGWC